MIAGFPFIASSFDPDARAFVQASGATDRAVLNFFVKGIKRLGLWNDMVCWPLRSAQNAGTGSTAYSLGGLGTYNGTLVNGPTWGADGITFDGTDDRISTALSIDGTQGQFSAFTVFKRVGQGSEVQSLMGTRTTGDVSAVRLIIFSGLIGIFSDYNPNALGSRFATIQSVLNDTYATAAFSLNKDLLAGNIWQNTTNAILLGDSNAATGSGNFGIGAQGADRSEVWKGDIAFTMAFNGVSLTSQQNSDLRNLYKQTIGQGLGLP